MGRYRQGWVEWEHWEVWSLSSGRSCMYASIYCETRALGWSGDIGKANICCMRFQLTADLFLLRSRLHSNICTALYDTRNSPLESPFVPRFCTPIITLKRLRLEGLGTCLSKGPSLHSIRLGCARQPHMHPVTPWSVSNADNPDRAWYGHGPNDYARTRRTMCSLAPQAMPRPQAP